MANWARSLDREGTPGPGSYNLRTQIGTTGPKFSIKGKYREERIVPETVPEYRVIPSSIGQGPKYTMGVKSMQSDREGTPGPSYCPPPFGSSRTRQSFGTLQSKTSSLSPRRPVKASYSYSQAGPGQYVPDSSQTIHAQTISPRYASSWMKPNDAPPSTQYTPLNDARFPSVPSFSIRSVPKKSKSDDTPGPADYSPIDTFSTRKSTVGSRVKDQPVHRTPGPGEYNVSQPIGKYSRKCGIGSFLPSKPDESSTTPYYSVPRLFDTPTACKTVHPKVPSPGGFETPGPGSYRRPDDWVKRGSTMASRDSTCRDSGRASWIQEIDSPGPAEYYVMTDGVLESSPRYSFGAGLGASWVNRTSNPGPGDYTPTKSDKKHGWTIRPRYEGVHQRSETRDAQLVVLPEDHGHGASIHNKETLPLVVK